MKRSKTQRKSTVEQLRDLEADDFRLLNGFAVKTDFTSKFASLAKSTVHELGTCIYMCRTIQPLGWKGGGEG